MSVEPRISVSRIVDAVRAEPLVRCDPDAAHVVALHPDGRREHHAVSPAYLDAWAPLSRVESRAAELVVAWLARPLTERVAPLLGRVLRRRSLRRSLAREHDSAIVALRSRVAAQFGSTRPIDPLSPLCASLAAAGVSASSIVPLLDVLGIEPAPGQGARERVQRRIDRWRKRESER